MCDKSDTWVEDPEGRIFQWDFCVIPTCCNRVWPNFTGKFCWPHSSSGKSVAQIIRENSTVSVD